MAMCQYLAGPQYAVPGNLDQNASHITNLRHEKINMPIVLPANNSFFED